MPEKKTTSFSSLITQDLFAGSIQGRAETCLGEEDQGAFTRAGTRFLLSPTCRSSSNSSATLLLSLGTPADSHQILRCKLSSLREEVRHSSRGKFILPASFAPPFFNFWRILVIHNNYMALLSFRSQCSSQEVENILFSRYRKEVIKGHSVVVSGK